MQLCPCPISAFRIDQAPRPLEPKYICKKVSTGSRHTLYLMIDCSPRKELQQRLLHEGYNISEEMLAHKKIKRSRKVMISGLCQVGLCEEKGSDTPVDVPWHEDYGRPSDIVAGRGTSFILNKYGHVYSFGFGRFGVLGHQNEETINLPKRIAFFDRIRVAKLSTFAFHVLVLTENNELYTWGRNDKGQLGLGFESPTNEPILKPTKINLPAQLHSAKIIDIAVGMEHSIILVSKMMGKLLNEENQFIYSWGDETFGQLGSGDKEFRAQPQENRYVTRFFQKYEVKFTSIFSGAYHCIALVHFSGQLVSWGASDYGQIGRGYLFHDPNPQFILNVEKVISVSAGMRHSAAISVAKTIDLFVWGYNSYGELGLGDTDIRLNPTRVTAFKNAKLLAVSCGERHTVVVTSHKPLHALEVPALRPYFKVLLVSNICFFLIASSYCVSSWHF
jgi:hypothetical protein